MRPGDTRQIHEKSKVELEFKDRWPGIAGSRESNWAGYGLPKMCETDTAMNGQVPWRSKNCLGAGW